MTCKGNKFEFLKILQIEIEDTFSFSFFFKFLNFFSFLFGEISPVNNNNNNNKGYGGTLHIQ
jgi:hypothetical protein